MATTIQTSARKNEHWGDDVTCVFTEAAVDGSGIRIPGDMRLVQVTSSTVVNAATITPQYSIDAGTTWLSLDTDLEGRTYPATATGAVLKLPKTFLLPGGCVFRMYSSASQTNRTWTARAGK